MRKGELIFNYVVMLGPLVFVLGAVWAMGLAYTMPRATFYAMIALFLAGFLMFATAKWSVIKQGQIFTFGLGKMTKSNRFLYVLGYLGMGLGLILFIGFALASR